MWTVQSIMSVLLTAPSVFHFTHGLYLTVYVFVWNQLRFCLLEILNHPSCFDDEEENPKQKKYFSRTELFHQGFCLRPSSQCCCIIHTELIVLAAEYYYLPAQRSVACDTMTLYHESKVVSMWNAFGKSLWPLMMGQ